MDPQTVDGGLECMPVRHVADDTKALHGAATVRNTGITEPSVRFRCGIVHTEATLMRRNATTGADYNPIARSLRKEW